MEEYNFKTLINSKFYLSNPLTNKVKKIWIVFHGYGQLAKYFLRKFDEFSSEENIFIAPQALNQFYLKGFNGRVGSTWMTSEDREEKIEDYINYLSNLDDLIFQLKQLDVEVNVLGFSQGGNTLSRYLQNTKLSINKIVFWASKYADDINQTEFFKKFTTCSFYLVYGVNDQLVPEFKIQHVLSEFNKFLIYPNIIKFNGGHEICEKIFLKVF